MNTLSYSVYNDKSLVVRGDRMTYKDIIKQVGGRWNSKMKGGPGWIVPRSKEELVKRLVEKVTEKEKEKEIVTKPEPIKKQDTPKNIVKSLNIENVDSYKEEQLLHQRYEEEEDEIVIEADEEDEEEKKEEFAYSSSESDDEIQLSRIAKKESSYRPKKNRNQVKPSNNDILSYYTQLGNNPSLLDELNADSETDLSEDNFSSEEEDDFPLPKEDDKHEIIFAKLTELQESIHNLERNFKKLLKRCSGKKSSKSSSSSKRKQYR